MDEKQAVQQQVKAEKSGQASDRETAPQKKRISGKAVAAILIVVLIAGIGVFYYFNLLGLKTRVIDFFKGQDPAYQTAIEEYNAEKEAYEQKKSELDAKEQALQQREQQLSEKEAEAAQGETATTGGGKSKSAKAVAPVFEQMDKAAAAEIFDNTTSDSWIAEVLGAIDEKKAAEILGAMDPAKASAVSQFMS
ncbi:hypothetical protein [Christensenella intestinihominis]|uniref:hypothetical protein n=1 Tax=Christensenella intestinihominis TaxID=1851429 RepID=UPI000829513C|nr:hypothetical protein [Christensenella intestinihominis]